MGEKETACDFLKRATMWMNLEDIMLSEMNKSQKDKSQMIPLR